MKQFCSLLAIFIFSFGSTYAQDIYLTVYANGRALTANGTTTTGLPRPVGGGDADDYVAITTHQYSFSNTAGLGTGPGGGVGKTIGSAIEITKRLDISTSNLLPYLFSGRHIDTAELVVRNKSSTGALITTIEFKDLLLANYSSSVSPENECCPLEGLSLIYTAIRITNYQQDSAGKVTPQTPVVWNFSTNSATY